MVHLVFRASPQHTTDRPPNAILPGREMVFRLPHFSLSHFEKVGSFFLSFFRKSRVYDFRSRRKVVVCWRPPRRSFFGCPTFLLKRKRRLRFGKGNRKGGSFLISPSCASRARLMIDTHLPRGIASTHCLGLMSLQRAERRHLRLNCPAAPITIQLALNF
jgi:hypothetical protein